MQPSPNRWWRLVAGVLTLGLVAGACGGGGDEGSSDTSQGGAVTLPPDAMPETNTDTPQPGGTLVYGIAAETNGWDPSTSQWGPWGLVEARSFFDTLTIFDENGEIQPYLAESFTPNEDYTSWVVKLRPGVTFHNGEALTAQVLKDNWDFFTASPLVGAIFERIESTTVLNDLELQADMAGQWVNFPKAFTTQIGVVMAPESLEADDATRAQHPIGTGPFVFDEWIQDRYLRVVRNDSYWQEGLPYLDEIEFQPIPDVTSRAQSLLTGDVDMAYIEEPQQVSQFEDDDEYVIWQDPKAETPESLVMLNTLNPPFDDLRVRQALAYGTDKELINETLFEGARELANGPYRSTSPWYTEVDYPQYDPAEAQRLVAEYEAEKGPLTFTMEVGAGGTDGAQLAQLLQSQWEQIGVEVELGSAEVASLIANVVVGDYQAVVWRQFDSAHPLQETVWWHEEGATDLGTIGLNFARNRDEVITAALDQARLVETSEEEKVQYDIVQEQLAADVPYIWLSHVNQSVIAEAGVHNVFHAPIPDVDVEMMALHNSAHAVAQIWVEQ